MAATRVISEPERKAYIALSRLFLDTATEVEDVASALRPLPIPISKLSNMLREDLFPILYTNLMSPAGVWDGFDESWLISQIEAQKKGGPGWAKQLVHQAAWFTLGQAVTSPWNQVKEKLQSKL